MYLSFYRHNDTPLWNLFSSEVNHHAIFFYYPGTYLELMFFFILQPLNLEQYEMIQSMSSDIRAYAPDARVLTTYYCGETIFCYPFVANHEVHYIFLGNGLNILYFYHSSTVSTRWYLQLHLIIDISIYGLFNNFNYSDLTKI